MISQLFFILFPADHFAGAPAVPTSRQEPYPRRRRVLAALHARIGRCRGIYAMDEACSPPCDQLPPHVLHEWALGPPKGRELAPERSLKEVERRLESSGASAATLARIVAMDEVNTSMCRVCFLPENYDPTWVRGICLPSGEWAWLPEGQQGARMFYHILMAHPYDWIVAVVAQVQAVAE